MVNEVAHALHKIFVFTNKTTNPLQKWKQGCWFATWSEEASDEYVCTLYVNILVQEAKIKPRKGHTVSWRRAPHDLWTRLQAHTTETIADGTSERTQWQQMAYAKPALKEEQPPATSPNRFAVLSDEDGPTTV